MRRSRPRDIMRTAAPHQRQTLGLVRSRSGELSGRVRGRAAMLGAPDQAWGVCTGWLGKA